jgi:chorismate-pyruvate lyase
MRIVTNVGPDVNALLGIFHGAPGDDVADYTVVPSGEVPQPYRGLLVHENHMTLSVEEHHGDRVQVRVLTSRQDRSSYARKILLALAGSGQVVEYGIARIDLASCAPAVRRAILRGRTPLGRILVEHGVPRRIEPTAYLRVLPGPALRRWFGLVRSRETYGRLGYIHTEGGAVIELLEIVAPEWRGAIGLAA